MKSLLLGFFGVFAVLLGIAFLIQNPAFFWLILIILLGAFVLGLINGNKRNALNNPERNARRNAALDRQGQISEDDIVHHHQPNGRPFDERGGSSSIIAAAAAGAAAAYILKPDAQPATPVVEPDPEIENSDAIYFDRASDYEFDEDAEG